jgi:hypothetical protein
VEDSLKEIATILTAAAALIAVVSGYVQFVVLRAILPCVEFDVDFVMLSSDGQQTIGEIVCTMKNMGPGSGYVANVQGRVRYRLNSESEPGPDGVEPAFPYLIQPTADAGVTPASILERGGFVFAKKQPPAFIQPKVTQWYRKPIMVPADAVLIHIWAAFEYRTEVGRIGHALARIFAQPAGRRDVVNYAVRRTFAVGP